MTVVAITRDHRFYASGLRIHHGVVGVGLVATGVALLACGAPLGLALVAGGITLIVDDWNDKPWRFRE